MSYRKQFEQAIRRVGDIAGLLKDQNAAFYAVIRPDSLPQGDGHGITGTGYLRRYTLFIPSGGDADSLDEGDSLICGGDIYLVQTLETFGYGGEAVYRRGVLFREEKGAG